MQNVLKQLKFLLSVIFLTEALHGQSKSSQNPKQTMAILAQPQQTRNFNTDRSKNPRNNEYNLESGGDPYSQPNRPPTSSYKQYKSNQEENFARNPLNANEEKKFANNGEEQGQRFVQPPKHRQKVNSFYQENGVNNPHQTTNSKLSQLLVQTPRTNQMNRGEYMSPHELVQDKKVQRPIRLFTDPYNKALEKHLQEKEERPLYEDYQKAPVNSRKALIHEEASEENSQWRESEALAPSSGRNNHQQEIHSYQPRNQFQNRELQSSQQSYSDDGFSSNTGQTPNSDSQTSYKQNFRTSQGTSRSRSHLSDLENADLRERDSVRKHPHADFVQQDSSSYRENFPPSNGNPPTVLRSSELKNTDMRNSFREHSNADPSLQENLHLRQNYPPPERMSSSVIQSDNLQNNDFRDSLKQHSTGDSSSENNFNQPMSGRNRSPYTQNSPDFEHRSTNKDYLDQRHHNFRNPESPPLERPHLKENSKNHASSADNFSPSQRLPHLDEELPSNYNKYSNEKAPFSHRSVQNSKHNFEDPLSRDNNPTYVERQQQSEGIYSDLSDEYSPISHQKSQNSGSTYRTSSRNGHRNQHEPPKQQELHTGYSDGQGKSHQELSQPREMHNYYPNGQDGNHQELPQPPKQHTDYSNRQGRNHQEHPLPRELYTDYPNSQGQNHQELPRPQKLHVGYSKANAPNFHQSTHTNANSQAQLQTDNLPLNYQESPPPSAKFQQKYSDESSPDNKESSRTSRIPYVRSFTEGRHLGHQETFQYLPEGPESALGDVSLTKKNSPSASRSKNSPSNKKGRKVAIGDYSVENHDDQPVEYHSLQKFHDTNSQLRGIKRQGKLESLSNVENPLKKQIAGESYSAPDSRSPTVERSNVHKSRSSRQRTSQRPLSPHENVQNLPVKRSSEDDSAVKNLTFSATVERDHIVSMGSEQEPDSEPEPEERDDDDDDFGEEQHDGFLDMGAYTDKQGSFGWYADFPVGRGHDKMSYSSS